MIDDLASTAHVTIDVQCGCGEVVPCEVPRAAANQQLAFICEGCRSHVLDAPALPPGYRLTAELGRGGMGAVYVARHETLGVDRAVKVILPKGALSEEMRELFLREARVHASLSHPRIVQVHDLSEVRPGYFCLVMEFVPGPDAGRLLARSPQGLSPRLAVGIACQALEALAYVHARSIVHCDVKDPNLLLVDEAAPSAKLSDFGLARSYALCGAASRRRAELTSGTIAYMPPEQATCSGEVRPAADLYSVGATLYRLLTGCYTRDFPPHRDRLQMAREDPVVPCLARKPDLPTRLAVVIDQALARDPGERPGSADQMRDALLAAL